MDPNLNSSPFFVFFFRVMRQATFSTESSLARGTMNPSLSVGPFFSMTLALNVNSSLV
jgi:hypothetical protein